MLILNFILFVILGSTIGILIILGVLFTIVIMVYKAEKLWEEIRKNR